MKIVFRAAIVLCSALPSRPSIAQIKLISPATNVTEAYIPIRAVKAQTVVGLSGDRSASPVGEDLPKVYVPGGVTGKICLDISSQDGTYTSHAEFNLNQLDPQVYALAFRSTHKEFQRFTIDSVAALAQVKNDCRLPSNERTWSLPVFWSSSTSPTSSVRLLLQTGDNSARVLSQTPGERPIKCEMTRGGSVVFNSECLLPPHYGSHGVTVVVIDSDNSYVTRVPLLLPTQ
jgi:hypothetical protein